MATLLSEPSSEPSSELLFSDPPICRILNDTTPLPPVAPTPEEDEDQFADFVWCDGPIKMDYGYNVKYVPSSMGV